MNILFVGVECFPFIKVGGLGDVLGSLPKELNKLGCDTRVIMPRYKTIKPELLESLVKVKEFTVSMGGRPYKATLDSMKFDNFTMYFIECDKFYGRDKVYGFDDELERWAFFQLAALESIEYMDGFYPDVINCHDWHTGMIPQLIKGKYYNTLGNIKSVFTIHNMAFQGEYDRQNARLFGIPYDSTMEMNGRMNFMKSAIDQADFVNTVSVKYKEELLESEYYGMGLSGVLNKKNQEGKFTGILNGIDYTLFDPSTDQTLLSTYGLKDYRKGKEKAKKQIFKELGVSFNENVPLIGLCSRLTDQKGLDLIRSVIEEAMVSYNFNFIIIGTGEKQYEDFFRYLEGKCPSRVKAYIGYSDKMAHLTYAASDIFLMPSRFEPCGLGQMIALKYGSLPLVRETGGLKDTVEPWNEYQKKGNGFSFTYYNANDLLHVLKYALKTYDEKGSWDILVKNAMSSDYSFTQSAKKYLELYKNITKK